MTSLKRLSIHSLLRYILVVIFISSILLSSLMTLAHAQNTDSTVSYLTEEQIDGYLPPPPMENLIHNGITREYILYLPKSYDGRSKLPLLLNFHGFGGMAKYHYYNADMRSIAESEQFMLVYPQGTLLNDIGDQAHWNAGLDTPENKSNADDFGFIEALIDKLSSTYLIDQERIYAIGYSNGGYFSYALACYHSDKIAAIASVSGTMLLETHGYCNPKHPTGMLNIHGTADDVVPYFYDGSDNLASTEAVISYWTNFNSGNHNKIQNMLLNTIQNPSSVGSENPIEHYTYIHSNNDIFVEHYRVVDGEHVWFDFTHNGANTNQLIWNFVSRYNNKGLR